MSIKWTPWNPWHGCTPISSGFKNCYVYTMDGMYGKDASIISRTQSFHLPLALNRKGGFVIPSGSHLFTCGNSDFFHPEADPWRKEAFAIMRLRTDVHFLIITKRIDRFYRVLPSDWGEGYDNITIGCTCEDQQQADYRLPLFLAAPIRHRVIACQPLLEPINLLPYLSSEKIQEVVAGGESGPHPKICDYQWILHLKEQCQACKVSFSFRQTGARFRKDGKVYAIPRKLQHVQAQKSGNDLFFSR